MEQDCIAKLLWNFRFPSRVGVDFDEGTAPELEDIIAFPNANTIYNLVRTLYAIVDNEEVFHDVSTKVVGHLIK